MQQVLQDIKTRALAMREVPAPGFIEGAIRVRTAASLVSAGTEKMLIDLGQKSLISKARARPDLVKQVISKARKEGVVNTFSNVISRMERPMPLGYSAAGIADVVGNGSIDVKTGDRLAIAGAGYANHAEVNIVPKNLVAVIPVGVSFEEAAYTTVASIALQGVRLAKPELGENVAVVGLGLIGMITAQLLKANGCRVLGIDLDAAKVKLATDLGMDEGAVIGRDDVGRKIEQFTSGRYADHTLITAATKSNDPIELAGKITRQKGQVVVVGAVGMDIPRDVYYKKELSVQVSMSYGPGRYDPSYEEQGIDYPYAYVRWTEQRNMEAVLQLMAEGKLDVKSLTTHRFPFERALDAYDLIQNGNEPYVGIVLEYDLDKPQEAVVRIAPAHLRQASDQMGVGFVGAGNYAAVHLLPHLAKRDDVALAGLVTATGLNAKQKAEKFGFSYCSTELDPILEDDSVDSVFIGTRHSTHAEFSVRTLRAGKNVFVEKPMVVSPDQLDHVCEAYEAANKTRATGLMVGLNRRFAPMVEELLTTMEGDGTRQMIYRVNSGHIPTTSWLHEEDEGAGMLVGEMCHFIDLMQFISGERPARVYARSLTVGNELVADHDNLSIVVDFDGGSVGTLSYNTVGDKSAPKERLEIYGGGCVATLDDFRRLEIVRNGKKSRSRSWNQDKGQSNQIDATVEAFRKGRSPIPFDQLVAGMRAVFAARESLRTGMPVDVEPFRLELDVPA